ncbi:hypothetical protein ABT352_22895 [Streptosporangium sp. NPDC000563]
MTATFVITAEGSEITVPVLPEDVETLTTVLLTNGITFRIA